MTDLALGESLYNQVCFHAHQAAEKSLKALVAHEGAEPPKTHRLTELLTLLVRSEPTLEDLGDELNALEIYYIPTRYPDAMPGSLAESLPGQEEAKEALATARKVFEITRKIIEPAEQRGPRDL